MPSRVTQNPYAKWPKTTNRDFFKYKMVNRDRQSLQTSLDKQFFVKKNELKTFKNADIVDRRRDVAISYN